MTKGKEITVVPILDEGDTVLYMINYTEGWSVMPADNRLPMGLISCDTGFIDEKTLFANEIVEDCLRSMIKSIKETVANPKPIDSIQTKSMPMSFYDENGVWWAYAYKIITREQTSQQKYPMIVTKWGQGDSSRKWNINAPYTSSAKIMHCPTGCTNVAAAQMLYYLHSKIGIPAGSPGFYYSTGYYDSAVDSLGHVMAASEIVSSYDINCWSYMPLSASSSVTDNQYKYVSSLMVKLGFLLHSSYTPTSTGTATLGIPAIFNSNYGIACSSGTFSTNTIKDQILSNYPVILSLAGSTGRHAIIADGYRKLSGYYTYVYKNMDDGLTTYKHIDTDEPSTSEFISLNFGWDGSGDRDSSGGIIWYTIGGPYSAGGQSYGPSYGNCYMVYDFQANQN